MKIKSVFILFCLVNTISVMYAQDVIFKRNGDEINAKVLVVGIKEVKYKEIENESDSIYTLAKSDIFMIKYENGTKDVFRDADSRVKSAVQYDYKNPAAAFGLSFIFPGLGQFYNGQNRKGFLMCMVGGASWITYYAIRQTSNTSARKLHQFTDLILVGTYLWSLTDAMVSAGVINRKNQALVWNLNKDSKLSITPDVLFSNSIGTKTCYQSPAYGLSLKLDF